MHSTKVASRSSDDAYDSEEGGVGIEMGGLVSGRKNRSGSSVTRSNVLAMLAAFCIGVVSTALVASIVSSSAHAPAGSQQVVSNSPAEPSSAALAVTAPAPTPVPDCPAPRPSVEWLSNEVGGAMMVTLQVSHLDANHMFPIPAEFKSVVMEIGANNRNTMDEEYLPSHPDAFLLTFEPIIDKYAQLTARIVRSLDNGGTDRIAPLGHHNTRGLIFPVAVAPTEGSLTFKLAPVDGCSTIGEFNDKGKEWAAWCFPIVDQRTVPTLRLETILNHLSPERNIDYLKIDAQGVDMQVLESAGPQLHRIKRVSMEIVSDRCPALYKGQVQCKETLRRMAELGFTQEISSPDEKDCVHGPGYEPHTHCEYDLVWTRP